MEIVPYTGTHNLMAQTHIARVTTRRIGFLNLQRDAGKLKALKHCVLAFLPVLLLVVIKFFVPQFQDNEAGKLLSGRQILDPTFLNRDWAVAQGHGDNVYDIVFAVLLAPLWLWLRNGILVALAARLLCWGAMLGALVKLTRTLTVEWYALACGFYIWICNYQALGAGEWIFGGAEAKCLAYALLMLAVDAALVKRLPRAGVYCGLAICCHVLVGAWGFVALGGALLTRAREYSWRCLAQFAALVAAACVPVAGMAWRYAVPGTHAEWQTANRMAVLFSDPMHLDPTYFGGWQEFVLLCVLAVVAGWAFFRVTERRQALLLCSFLAVLLLEFLSGLLAWETKQFWFLKSFPFRVPDTLIYLFLMLAFPSFFARLLTRMGAQIKEDRLKPRTRQTWRRLALFFSLALPAAAGMLFEIQSVATEDLPVFAGAWGEYIQGRKTPWQEMTEWVREKTPKPAIVLAPPWEFSFWIDAERAQVVSYKRPPHNAHLLEWHRRMTEMNGEPFHSRGEWILDELKQHYPKLSLAQIESIRAHDGADYYLTTQERGDLRDNLVHANDSYYLYQLWKPGTAYQPVAISLQP